MMVAKEAEKISMKVCRNHIYLDKMSSPKNQEDVDNNPMIVYGRWPVTKSRG